MPKYHPWLILFILVRTWNKCWHVSVFCFVFCFGLVLRQVFPLLLRLPWNIPFPSLVSDSQSYGLCSPSARITSRHRHIWLGFFHNAAFKMYALDCIIRYAGHELQMLFKWKLSLKPVVFSHISFVWPGGYYFSTDKEPTITTESSAKWLRFPSKVIYSNSKLSAWLESVGF